MLKFLNARNGFKLERWIFFELCLESPDKDPLTKTYMYPLGNFQGSWLLKICKDLIRISTPAWSRLSEIDFLLEHLIKHRGIGS